MNHPETRLLDAWQQRYADPQARGPKAANDTLKLLMSHRSVRRYRPDPVTDDTLHTLIGAAQSASSSSNLQSWSVVAVRDRALKAQLSELAGQQAFIDQAPLFLVWLADFGRVRQVAEAHETELVAPDYFEGGLIGAIDAALAAQNTLVAAESLGLGGVFVGGVRNHTAEIAALLGLSAGVVPVFGMAMGYPDPADRAGIKPRLGQGAVLHLERYDAARQLDEVNQYEARIAQYYAGQQLRQGWVQRALTRLGSLAAMNGRDRLRDVWQRLGLPLN